MGSGSQIRWNAEGTMQNSPGPRLWERPGVLLTGTLQEVHHEYQWLLNLLLAGSSWENWSPNPAAPAADRNCSSWQTEHSRFTLRQFLEGTQKPSDTYSIHHTERELKSFPKGVWHVSLGEKIREVRQICWPPQKTVINKRKVWIREGNHSIFYQD